MKKLAAHIAVGFLSVGVASPAFSDVDCVYVKKEAEEYIDSFKGLTEMMRSDEYSAKDREEFREWRNEAVPVTNMLTNIYSTFCK